MPTDAISIDSSTTRALPAQMLMLQVPDAVTSHVIRAHKEFLEVFARLSESALGVAVETEFTGTEQGPLSEFLAAPSERKHTLYLQARPLGDIVVVQISNDLLWHQLNTLLASPADVTADPDQSFTALDLHLLRQFFLLFSEALSASWRLTPESSFALLDAPGDSAPEHSQAQVLKLKSEFQLMQTTGSVDLLIPAFLGRVSDHWSAMSLDRALAATSAQAGSKIVEILQDVPVNLDAIMTELKLRCGDLALIKPGHILLGQKVEDSVFEGLVNGSRQFEGQMVAAGDHYAFQLTRLIKCDAAAARGPER